VKIGGWHIDGFGIFHDFEASLSDGLTVFLGPNEAGKSTLLGFLRAALFGFPSRRSRAPQYPPLRGGRHGGRLILCGPQGEVIVERTVARKNGLRLNGREGMDEDLRALLGGADENVFSSVFAFSLIGNAIFRVAPCGPDPGANFFGGNCRRRRLRPKGDRDAGSRSRGDSTASGRIACEGSGRSDGADRGEVEVGSGRSRAIRFSRAGM